MLKIALKIVSSKSSVPINDHVSSWTVNINPASFYFCLLCKSHVEMSTTAPMSWYEIIRHTDTSAIPDLLQKSIFACVRPLSMGQLSSNRRHKSQAVWILSDGTNAE